MTRSPRPSGLLGGGGLLVLSAGVAVGLLVAPVKPPRDVEPVAGRAEVVVERTEYTETREADLIVVPVPPTDVTSPAGGLVTSTTCDPADPFVSGTSRITVDDRPLILLATARPLWRDLAVGDEGPDVAALQNELRRLGRDVDVDGFFGRQTLRQVRAMAASAGRASDDWEELPKDAFVWIPGPSIDVSLCSARTGDRLEPGDALARLSASVASAHAEAELDDFTGWEAQLDGEVVHLTETGAVGSAEELGRLMRTPSYLSGASGGGQPGSSSESRAEREVTIAVELRRAAAEAAYAVPPSALYDIQAGRGCVMDDGKPARVTILGSQLGKTYVAPTPRHELSRIALDPRGAGPCG